MKRLLDIVVSLIGLICLLPNSARGGRLDQVRFDGSEIFFRQERIGKGFRPFQILKFRTMIHSTQKTGGLITIAKDPRVTRVGRILRNSKIDELPQIDQRAQGGDEPGRSTARDAGVCGVVSKRL